MRSMRASMCSVVDARFSTIAAILCTIVSVLAAVKGAFVVAAVWAVLALGFAIRAAIGYRRR
jgi:hypothetical protein